MALERIAVRPDAYVESVMIVNVMTARVMIVTTYIGQMTTLSIIADLAPFHPAE